MSHKVLLINPAINPESQNKIITSVVNSTMPTSIGVLAAYIAKYGGHESRILDEQVEFLDRDRLRDAILDLPEPRVVGISVLTVNARRAYQLAEMIKDIAPLSHVVFGGIHPSVLTDEVLTHKGVDIVVRGEGERTFAELIDLIASRKDYSKINGISLNHGDKIQRNQERPLIQDLDEIPPFPYYLFEKHKDKYTSFGSIFTSRGCPHNCIFCSSRSVSGKKYRCFSTDRVISEIKLLIEKYEQKTVWWMDDNIAVDKRRFISLLDSIISQGLNKKATFHGSMRGDNVNAEILAKAKEANFKMLAFGLETGSERLMKVLNKGETVQVVVDAIKKTHEAGIAAATTIIFGIPTETRKERWETLRMVNKLPLSSARFNTLVPYPGTPAFELATKENNILIKKDWANFAVQYMWEGDEIPYVPRGESRYELMFDTMFANLYFCLSVEGIKRMLRSSFAGGNVVVLPKRWYLSMPLIWRFARVLFYLLRRFCVVSVKAAFYRRR